MGIFIREPLCPTVWLLNVNQDGKSLNEHAISVIRLTWRVIYRHFTRVETDNASFYRPQVIKDVARAVMDRINAFKVARRRFFLKRKHTILQHLLPKKARKQIAPLGKLNVNGSLTLKRPLADLLRAEGVYRDL